MMMPANFTAVNSEVVYGGADLFTVLADTTAPVWNASNVKTFNTNILTILSNTFTDKLVGATLGTMFGGSWGKDEGKTLFGKDDGTVRGLFHKGNKIDGDSMTNLNKVMTGIGLAASVYTLGTTSAKNYISEEIIKAF
mgnify:CR=1 FL=1